METIKPIAFDDEMEKKIVHLDPIKTSYVAFRIKGVYRGNLYDDTCIAEIAFYYHDRKIELQGVDELKNTLARLSSPSGYHMRMGYMVSTHYYFFPDGSCLGRTPYPGDRAAPAKLGKWSFSKQTRTVTIVWDQEEVIEGFGKKLQDKYEGIYFENYRYYVRHIHKTEIQDWAKCLRYYQSAKTSLDYEVDFDPLTKDDFKLRTLPSPGIKDEIERLREEYRNLKENPDQASEVK